MYTTNIVSIETLADGRKRIGVQFTNGIITTPTEFVIPQDKNGLDFYVKGWLEALNFVEPPIGAYVLPVLPVVPAKTQEEIDFENFAKWLNITIAINSAKQLGWITGDEAMVVNAKNKTIALALVNLPKLFL